MAVISKNKDSVWGTLSNVASKSRSGNATQGSAASSLNMGSITRNQSEIWNNSSGVARPARTSENASNKETSPMSLYRKYTKDFVLPGSYDTISHGFRKGDGIFFSGAYDEPTYLTFRLEFDFDCDEDYAIASVGQGCAQYNEMPHPLFNVIFNDVFRKNPQKNRSKIDNSFLNDSNLFPTIVNHNTLKDPGNVYSAYNYLKYNLGEDYRALMLLKLKALLYDIQFNYPYYFTSVEGLQNLMKVDTTKGIRIPEENNTITIKCNEALDLRITQFLNLYRKIVWDDVYQRWILPDMMRFFKLKIHIFEIRMFHEVIRTDQPVDLVNPVSYSSRLMNVNRLNNGAYDMTSSYINELLPTLTIECSQCQFDLGDNMTHIGNLSSSNKQKSDLEPTIKIHVGNILETQSYNLNKIRKDNYYSDKSLSRDRLYSDDNEYTGENYKESWRSNSSTINRLGIDALTDEYSTDRQNDTYPLNRVDYLRIPAFSRSILWPSMIRSIFDYGVNWIKDKTVDGVDWLLSQPIGGSTVGGVLKSAAVGVNMLNEGNFVFFHNLLKSAIKGNPAVEEVEGDVRYNEPNLSDKLSRMIIGNMPESAATEIENALREVYDKSLKGLSNEASQNKDQQYVPGYVPTGMQQPKYQSTATNGIIVDRTDPKDKGLSNEAIEDKDNGYVQQVMIQSPYVSTANSLPLVDNTNPLNKGLSNEAIEDRDNGYVSPSLNQPPYSSSATSKSSINNAQKGNQDLYSEAIEDRDNGYVEPAYIK